MTENDDQRNGGDVLAFNVSVEGPFISSSVRTGTPSQSSSPVKRYFEHHNILDHLESAVIQLGQALPERPLVFLGNQFLRTGWGRVSSCTQTDKVQYFSSLTQMSYEDVCLDPEIAPPPPPSKFDPRMPDGEIDANFPEYLTHLAASVRKGTS